MSVALRKIILTFIRISLNTKKPFLIFENKMGWCMKVVLKDIPLTVVLLYIRK